MRLGSRIRLGEGDVAARGKAVAALGARLCFEDEAGFSMTPPTARTWARRGDTPVIRVRGRSQRRFFIAALASYKPGERSRLIYRPKRHVDHKHGGRRSFTWTDYRDLLTAAHQQLGAPIVLVLDILNVHRDRRLREFIDTDDWITCYFLPAYTPDLNPVEGIWSLLRRSSQANTAFTDPDHLMRSLRHNYAKWEADGTTQQVHDLLRDVDWQTSRHGGRARRASPRHPPALHDPGDGHRIAGNVVGLPQGDALHYRRRHSCRSQCASHGGQEPRHAGGTGWRHVAPAADSPAGQDPFR
jgi:hypothetical protein